LEVLPPNKSEASATSSLVVLLVDDDWLVAISTQRMLEDLGHKAVVVSSAAGALEVLQSGLAVDLTITDQAMPEMTGRELIGRIREAWPRLPVLLATGYAELPNGLQNVPRLLKPYRQADLVAWIERLAGSTRHGAAETNVLPLQLH
jgi:CheY-like chemotaxis protein